MILYTQVILGICPRYITNHIFSIDNTQPLVIIINPEQHMHKLTKITLYTSIILISIMGTSHAESLWDKTKTAVSDTAGKVSDTANDLVSSDETTPTQARKEIDDNAKKALSRLFSASQQAKEFYDKSAGYAVFDSREFAFMIKTGFGTGVAINKKNNSKTYMKMASGGLNIGGGIKYLQVVFIFPTNSTLNEFVNDGWTAEGDASAVGGEDSEQVGITLANGTRIYQLSDTGLMLKMSISGTKYWKNDELNQ